MDSQHISRTFLAINTLKISATFISSLIRSMIIWKYFQFFNGTKINITKEYQKLIQKINNSRISAYFFSTNRCCRLLLKASIIDDKALSLVVPLYPKGQNSRIQVNAWFQFKHPVLEKSSTHPPQEKQKRILCRLMNIKLKNIGILAPILN